VIRDWTEAEADEEEVGEEEVDLGRAAAEGDELLLDWTIFLLKKWKEMEND
jgi:hypothetical protein